MLRWFVLLILSAGMAAAQVASAELFGEVRDEASLPVPGAAVVARHAGTGFVRSTTTDEQGHYRMEALRPGPYAVTVEKDGFGKTTASGVVLEVSQRARLDLAVKIATESGSITVAASVSPVRTEDASAGYLLDRTTMSSLPLAVRNVISLVTLGPGAIPRQLGGFVHDVVNDVQEGTRGAVALNPPINGGRSTMNTFLLDGAYDTDRAVYAIAVYPPMESVQEFQILTSLSPAGFPQSGGGAIDVVTKSGGQTLHGSALEYLRNEAGDARNFFDDPALPRPIFRQNQFGGSLGGPLPLARSFFFAAYEGLRGKSGTSSLSLVPDASLRGGDFSGRNALFDPFSGIAGASGRTPIPGNIIPASQLDPIAVRYLERFEPLPNRVSQTSNYLDSTPNQAGTDSVSARIDHQFGDQSVLISRYTLNRESNRIAGSFPLLANSEQLRAQQAVLGHTLARQSWVNEVRLSFTRLRTFDLPENAFRRNIAAELGIQGAPDDPQNYGLPYFLVTNFSMVTDSPTLPQIQRDNTWHAAEGFSLRSGGSHTLKAGFEWIGFQLNYLQSRLARGQYTYTGAFTSLNGRPETGGDALADFLLGVPQVTSRSVGSAQAYLSQNSLSGYIGDDWKVNAHLTLNLGLRYEYVSPFRESRGNLQNLVYNGGNPPQLARVDSAVDPDRTNFAPRVGMALRLPRSVGGAETVFRAGYGIYFSPEISIGTYDLVLNGIRNERNETDGAGVPLLTTINGFPKTASTGLPDYFGIDRAARTPQVQQWTGSLQRELPGRVVLDVAYVGTKGTHLGRFRQFNTPAHVETGENLNPRPGDLQSLRPFPEIGRIIQRQNIANSIYHSLQVKTEKRLSGGVALLGSFVWSKSIDDADSIIPGLFDSIGAQDERNLRLERGLSFFDVGRRVSVGFVSRLPEPPALRPLLRNWQLSGIVTLQDGTPLNPAYFAFDPANSGTPNRPDVVPGQSVRLSRGERTPERFFNTDAFSAPAPYHFGNAGRNILPGPGNNIFDFALRRRFQVREGHTVEFRVESFNIFNHPNWGIPGPYPDFGPFFGKIFSVGEPRRMQMALRYEF
jgi:hypothetical protein